MLHYSQNAKRPDSPEYSWTPELDFPETESPSSPLSLTSPVRWLPIPTLRDEKVERDLAELECRIASLANTMHHRLAESQYLEDRLAESQYLAATLRLREARPCHSELHIGTRRRRAGARQHRVRVRRPPQEADCDGLSKRSEVDMPYYGDEELSQRWNNLATSALPPPPLISHECSSMVLPRSLPAVPQFKLVHVGYVYLPGALPLPPQLPQLPVPPSPISSVAFYPQLMSLPPMPSSPVQWITSIDQSQRGMWCARWPSPIDQPQRGMPDVNDVRSAGASAVVGQSRAQLDEAPADASLEYDEVDAALENFRKKQRLPWKFVRVGSGKYSYGGHLLEVALIGRKLKARHNSVGGGHFKSLRKFVALFDPGSAEIR